jgi:hypothetical protein
MQLEGFIFTSDLFLGLICSFRNVTLTSITSCGLITYSEAKLQMKAYIMTSPGRGGGLLAQAPIPTKR